LIGIEDAASNLDEDEDEDEEGCRDTRNDDLLERNRKKKKPSIYLLMYFKLWKRERKIMRWITLDERSLG
jgi:hypothetical protein